MKTPQLVWVVAVVVIPTVACSRAETNANARVAATEVKDVAARAGERLADSWLATKIQAQYFADDDVKARNILVTAQDGVVTLKGRVDDQNAHDQALQIARNTDGVTYIKDQLTQGIRVATPFETRAPVSSSTAPVATSGTVAAALAAAAERLNDPGITASIQAKYFLDSSIKARRIAVDARQGVVTLSGEVASDDERAQALILARTTDGVERVEDALTVNLALDEPAPTANEQAQLALQAQAQAQDAALAAQVESKLGSDRQLKSSAFEVTAKDGVVLVEGTVPTAAVRQRALTLARDTQGVLQVIDRLKIARRR